MTTAFAAGAAFGRSDFFEDFDDFFDDDDTELDTECSGLEACEFGEEDSDAVHMDVLASQGANGGVGEERSSWVSRREGRTRSCCV